MREGGGSPDFRRVRLGDWLAGAWGLALLFALWAEWYDEPAGGATAWEAFVVIDVLLLLGALLGIALPVVTAFRAAPSIPLAVVVWATAVALLDLLLVLYRLINEPGANVEVAVDAGAWIGTACVAGLLISLAFAMRDEASPGLEPGPTVPVLPTPPPESPRS